MLLPYFTPDVELGAAAETNNEGQPKQDTALANRLGVLAQSEARREEGHDAEAEIVEAAEETVFPLIGSGISTNCTAHCGVEGW